MRENPGCLEPASFPRRFAALIYDSLLIIGLLFPITLILLWLKGGAAFSPGDPLLKAVIALTIWGFYIGFWTHGGQTLGMRAWGIEVVGPRRGTLSIGPASLHFFLGILLCLPLGLGWWWSLLDPKRRPLHEILSGARIIRKRQSRGH